MYRSFIPISRVLSIAFLCLLVQKADGINVTLGPGDFRCFISVATNGDRIIGSVGLVPADAVTEVNLYQVQSHSVRTVPKDPIPSLDLTNLNYPVKASAYYALCVSNKHHEDVTFVVSFRVENNMVKTMAGLSTVDDLKGVLRYAQKLKDTTKQIMERMEAYSTREYLLSKVIDKMNSRIVSWSVVQMIVVVGLCAYQIYRISSFFEVKSFV